MNGKTKSATTRSLQGRLLGLRQSMQAFEREQRALPPVAESEHLSWQRGRRGAYLAALQITREVA